MPFIDCENSLLADSYFPKDGIYFQDSPSPLSFWSNDQFRSLLLWAVQELNASDLAFEQDMPPYVRANGSYRMACPRVLKPADLSALLRLLAGTGTAESSILAGEPKDFRYQVEVRRGVYRRFRCNATAKRLPDGRSALSLVLRSIPSALPSLEEARIDRTLLGYLYPPAGLVLITGPMGSGKTTTLAAALRYRRESCPHLAIGTYEDPVEFDLSACRSTGPLWQIEIPYGIHDFKDVARNMSRRAVDIVLIGESRDRESFQALLGASNMGIALYTTLHSNSVADALFRIVNEFPVERQHSVMGTLVKAFRFVVHQRLVPSCDGKRIVLREYLPFTEQMRMDLAAKKSINEAVVTLHALVKDHGRPLVADAACKYRAGEISQATYGYILSEFQDMERVASASKTQKDHAAPGALPKTVQKSAKPLAGGDKDRRKERL